MTAEALAVAAAAARADRRSRGHRGSAGRRRRRRRTIDSGGDDVGHAHRDESSCPYTCALLLLTTCSATCSATCSETTPAGADDQQHCVLDNRVRLDTSERWFHTRQRRAYPTTADVGGWKIPEAVQLTSMIASFACTLSTIVSHVQRAAGGERALVPEPDPEPQHRTDALRSVRRDRFPTTRCGRMRALGVGLGWIGLDWVGLGDLGVAVAPTTTCAYVCRKVVTQMNMSSGARQMFFFFPNPIPIAHPQTRPKPAKYPKSPHIVRRFPPVLFPTHMLADSGARHVTTLLPCRRGSPLDPDPGAQRA
jgi:hypothetical protein